MTSRLLVCGPGKEGSLEGYIDIASAYQFESMTLYAVTPCLRGDVEKAYNLWFYQPSEGLWFFSGDITNFSSSLNKYDNTPSCVFKRVFVHITNHSFHSGLEPACFSPSRDDMGALL